MWPGRVPSHPTVGRAAAGAGVLGCAHELARLAAMVQPWFGHEPHRIIGSALCTAELVAAVLSLEKDCQIFNSSFDN